MTNEFADELKNQVAATLDRINAAWRENRPESLRPFLHERVVMAYPGFSGSAAGRETLIAGFVDFCQNARVLSYHQGESQIDVVGGVAIASYPFEMVYEREGASWHSTGRDLWVFERSGDEWLAVWRTMLDLSEQPAQDG